jgi:hypothetical protein
MASQHNISQRRQGNSVPTSLPIALEHEEVEESKKRRRREMPLRQRIIAVVAASTLAAFFLLFWSGNTNQSRRQLRDTSALPLSKYSELLYALENSDLVALYFAASWCGMSTPISHALDEAFGDSDQILTLDGERKSLSIVFISSDRSLDDYNNYVSGRNWIAIPYESPQRTQLKTHFKTCARPEVEKLGIDREREIPTIIVIDSRNHNVLTFDGVKDMKHLKQDALDHWIELQQQASEGNLAEIA